jgi:hypothetical protein
MKNETNKPSFITVQDSTPTKRGLFDSDIHITPKQLNEITGRSAEAGFDEWMLSQFGLSIDKSYRIVVVYSHPSRTQPTELIGEPSVSVDPAEGIPVDALRGKTQAEADAMVEEKRNREIEANPPALGKTSHEQSVERHAEADTDRDAQPMTDTNKP